MCTSRHLLNTIKRPVSRHQSKYWRVSETESSMALVVRDVVVLVLLCYVEEAATKSYTVNGDNPHSRDKSDLLVFKFSLTDFERTDPDFNRNVTQLIQSKGYPCEEYEVATEDGFILGLQRIPPNNKLSNPPVVFLQHGLLDSAATWVINSPKQSLGFILADAGCDVWFGNVRGNTYSRKHKTLKPSDAKFWDWSWDEMAKYDLPAMLNYISQKTGSKEINYIGHSQGTLVAFAAFSKNLQLAKLVKQFIALGPVATVGYVKGFLKHLSSFYEIPELLFKVLGIHEFLPSSLLIRMIVRLYCDKIFVGKICETIILMGGLDKNNANISRLPVYASHDPAGTSIKNIIHFAQMIRSKKFQMYDYRCPIKNQLHYNQTTAPLYNAKDMKVPTYLLYGGKDHLATPQDVELLIKNLTCLVSANKIPEYQHLDFIWGLNAAEVVYNQIIPLLLFSLGTPL